MSTQEFDRRVDVPVKKEILRETCSFCAIPELKTTPQYQELYGDQPHTLTIPGVSKEFTVLQDVVPVAEEGAHLLLMPNKHRISLATVEDQAGVQEAMVTIVDALRAFYPQNPIFTFEHGPGFVEGEQIACGGCHMDHAHGHMLVLPEGSTLESIRTKMEEDLSHTGWENPAARGVESEAIFTNIADITGMSPYVQIGMIDGDHMQSVTYAQHKTSENVESQLLRRIISQVVYDKPQRVDWHWRDITEGFTTNEKLQQLRDQAKAFRQKTGF
ncbi:MAG: hypothetical protein ABI758_00110 [Candidatus Woesebacteria bacterium]